MACGVLEWTPAAFWAATPYEFAAALDGWNEKNGGRRQKSAALTREELEELMLMYPDED